MFLDPRIHTDYDKHIRPFVKNGVMIDTCVIKEIIDGIILTRITGRKSEELEKIESFLQLLKINWTSLFVTPHILTETCKHLRTDYEGWQNHKQILKEIMPVIKAMGERPAHKEAFLKIIEDAGHLALEAGDISIFVATDDFISTQGKTALLSNDGEVNDRYKDDSRVMVLDYRNVLLNLS